MRIPYTYSANAPDGRYIIGLSDIECEVETDLCGLDNCPTVTVEHVWVETIGDDGSRGRIDLMVADEHLKALGHEIAGRAEDDSDIQDKTYAAFGVWVGAGPSERFKYRRAG